MTGTALLKKFQPDVLRSIDSATFSGSYQAVGSPLGVVPRVIKFTNSSSVAVTISWDGVHDHDFLTANGFLLIDVAANNEVIGSSEISKGIQFYVKGASGSGLFYISVYFAS